MSNREFQLGLHYTAWPRSIGETSTTYSLDPDLSGYQANLDLMGLMELHVLLAYLDENTRLVREAIARRRRNRDGE